MLHQPVKDLKGTNNELLPNKNTALSCFCVFRTFNLRRCDRMYAQVLSENSNPQTTLPLQNNLSTHIVVIRKNANARPVTPPWLVCQLLATFYLASKIVSTVSHKMHLLNLQNRILCPHCRIGLKFCSIFLIILYILTLCIVTLLMPGKPGQAIHKKRLYTQIKRHRFGKYPK